MTGCWAGADGVAVAIALELERREAADLVRFCFFAPSDFDDGSIWDACLPLEEVRLRFLSGFSACSATSSPVV